MRGVNSLDEHVLDSHVRVVWQDTAMLDHKRVGEVHVVEDLASQAQARDAGDRLNEQGCAAVGGDQAVHAHDVRDPDEDGGGTRTVAEDGLRIFGGVSRGTKWAATLEDAVAVNEASGSSERGGEPALTNIASTGNPDDFVTTIKALALLKVQLALLFILLDHGLGALISNSDNVAAEH